MLLSIVIVLVLGRAERLLRHVRARHRLRPQRPRLETMAKAGNRGAARALRLAEDPTGFLSTVQIGITLIGIFAGAYCGATLSEPLAEALRGIPAVAARRRRRSPSPSSSSPPPTSR